MLGTPTGFEPAASRATILRSNQLSYEVRDKAEHARAISRGSTRGWLAGVDASQTEVAVELEVGLVRVAGVVAHQVA